MVAVEIQCAAGNFQFPPLKEQVVNIFEAGGLFPIRENDWQLTKVIANETNKFKMADKKKFYIFSDFQFPG